MRIFQAPCTYIYNNTIGLLVHFAQFPKFHFSPVDHNMARVNMANNTHYIHATSASIVK